MQTLCLDLHRYLASYLDPVDKHVIYFTNKALRWKMGICQVIGKSFFLTRSARQGYFDLLRWGYEKHYPFTRNVQKAAIVNGELSILQWLKSINCPEDKKRLDLTAKQGNLEMVQWFLTNGCQYSSFTLRNAAGSGNLDLVKWLYEQDCPKRTNLLEKAAQNGHVHILEWGLENIPKLSFRLLALSAVANLDSLRFCFARGYLPGLEACSRAIFYGNLQSLQYLLKNGYPLPVEVLEKCLKYDRLEILAYLVSQKHITLPEDILFQAAMLEAKSILLWLRGTGHAWTEELTQSALEAGKLYLFKWLIKNKCPCTEDVQQAYKVAWAGRGKR